MIYGHEHNKFDQHMNPFCNAVIHTQICSPYTEPRRFQFEGYSPHNTPNSTFICFTYRSSQTSIPSLGANMEIYESEMSAIKEIHLLWPY